VPRSRTPIRALVVDYGEVLSKPPDPETFAGMARSVGAEPELFTDAYWELRPRYDRGELDGPAYWSAVGAKLGTSIDAGLAAGLVQRDIALWSRVDDPMLGWANAAASDGVRVGLLSNMVAEIGVHLRDSLRLFERFAAVTYSFELGLAKPDPRIYERALTDLEAEPHEALLVDDRAPNVEAARSVGMQAHLFRGRDALLAEIEASYVLVAAARHAAPDEA
jgi:putative hydrolase of the HAD superfamily